VTTAIEFLEQIDSKTRAVSRMAVLSDTDLFARSPVMTALAKQDAAIEKLAQAHSRAIAKLVMKSRRGMTISGPALEEMLLQAEALARFGDATKPSSGLLKAIERSQTQLTKTSRLFAKNVALLQAQQLGLKPVRLVSALPSISALAAKLATDKEGEAVLDRAGFDLVCGLVGGSYAAELAAVSPQVAGAAVTNKLLKLTKSGEFENWLQEHCNSSPILQRRWPILAQALASHRRREYWLSVPVLFSQLEGMISDALVLKSTARKVKGKFYELDQNGNVKLKDGRPVELGGLVTKVKKFPLVDHDLLRGVVDLVHSDLARRRNLVLHGSDVRYGKAKLSTQLLLSVYLWALEIAAFVT